MAPRRLARSARQADSDRKAAIAHATVSDALARLLDPVEDLLRDQFYSGPEETNGTARASPRARTATIAARTRWRLTLFVLRLRHSHRAPYRQLRAAVVSCAIGVIIFGLTWFAVERYG